MTAPAGIAPLLGFPPLLRRHGFRVSPDQTIGFLEAVGILGPRGMEDIRRSGIALFGVGKEREPEYDVLFDAHFLDRELAAAAAAGDDEEDLEVREDRGGEAEAEADEEAEASGMAAAEAERLGRRRFAERGEDRLLAEFVRSARRALPRRNTYRFAPSRRGEAVDFRRTLKEAQRSGGEAVTLAMKARKRRQRPILLLIDVSGSMKDQTETTLRFAHALAVASDRLEAFTFGTRLTRVTRALKLRDRGRSISRIASLVADMDGGTRLGASLEAFLETPRFRGFAGGSLAIVVSDGLERGSADRMVEAVRRLSAVAWRLYWLSPLAGDGEFSPRTEALARSMPYLDGVGDGGSAEALTECVLEAASLR